MALGQHALVPGAIAGAGEIEIELLAELRDRLRHESFRLGHDPLELRRFGHGLPRLTIRNRASDPDRRVGQHLGQRLDRGRLAGGAVYRKRRYTKLRAKELGFVPQPSLHTTARSEMETEENSKTEGFKAKLMQERSISIKVSLTAITAALYIALGYIFQPISFLGLQFRVAELIVGMCILFPWEGLIGNVIGVFFVNLTSPLGPIDLISCLVNIPALYCIIFLRDKRFLKYIGGVLYAIIISIYVAIILNFILGLPIWLMFIQVLIAELILATLGILIFDIIKMRLKL